MINANSNPAPTDQVVNPFGVTDRWTAIPPRIRSVLTWFGVFVAVVVLKRDALLLPASWDESWAVLPGGLWLSDNGFNILGLAKQPLHFEFGPGTYALAPVTWMTGIVATFARSTSVFLVSLRLVHMAIGAVGLREVYRFARPVWSPTASVVLVVVTALVPVMNAQLGFMYLEIPIFTTGMLAINAGLAGRWGTATFWGALATSFKASGILPLGAIVSAGFMAQRTMESFRRSVLVVLPAMAIGLIPVLLDKFVAMSERDLGHLLWVSWLQIFRIPELAIGLLFIVLFGVLPDRSDRSSEPDVRLRLDTLSSLILMFIGFYLFALSFVVRTFFLPRYFIMIVPFVLFAAWEVGARRFGPRVAAVATGLLVVSMIINMSSTYLLDPNEVTTVGLESSNAYAESLLLTNTILDRALQTGDPVYLSNNLWFRTQYPRLGYVEVVPENAHLLTELNQDDPPDTFVIVDSENSELVDDALELLGDQQDYAFVSATASRGILTARYVTFTRKSG